MEKAIPQNEMDLESFRRQWQRDVQARARKAPEDGSSQAGPSTRAPVSQGPSEAGASETPSLMKQKSAPPPATSRPKDYGWEHALGTAYHDVDDSVEGGRRLSDGAQEPPQEPRTALETYERAEERERQGELGESVRLYRKAFKLDPEVDKVYKKKHFPPGSFKPAKAQGPAISVQPSTGTEQSFLGLSTSISSLLEGFSSLSIVGEPPPTDLSPTPPCPIASIPEEILVDILLHTAVVDLASFARLAQVCKRLAFLVLTEERVWKRIVCGPEYGFAAMHYRFACSILGASLGDDGTGGRILGMDDDDSVPPLSLSLPKFIPLTQLYPSYRNMFRTRPRIRFNGLYISTVEYTRSGNRSNTLAWGDPVLTVTYYRYLRFYRDGTCISLQTTTEPRDVVPHLRRENLKKEAYPQGLPWAFMKDALAGRWRMTGPDAAFASTNSPPGSNDFADEYLDEKEGEIEIQTEGSVAKYTFHMRLAFGGSGKHHARNNKLNWKGFWSHNTLSDDWAEFTLRNDRAFIWSRVRSYGTGLDQPLGAGVDPSTR